MLRRLAFALAALSLAGCHPRGSPNGAALPPQVAGRWYPANAEQLSLQVTRLLDDAGRPAPVPVLALLVPHAGLPFSGPTAAAAFAAVRDRHIDRVVIVAPSHGHSLHAATLPIARAMATPLGELSVDAASVRHLAALPGFAQSDEPYQGEHSVEVVLPFVQRALGKVSIVPVLVGEVDAGQAAHVAAGLRQVLGARSLLVASSDLTRYGLRFDYQPFGKEMTGARLQARLAQIDALLLGPILGGDLAAFQRLGSHVCGQGAIEVLLATLPAGTTGLLRKYQGSFARDATERENEVGYAGIVFPGSWPDANVE